MCYQNDLWNFTLKNIDLLLKRYAFITSDRSRGCKVGLMAEVGELRSGVIRVVSDSILTFNKY